MKNMSYYIARSIYRSMVPSFLYSCCLISYCLLFPVVQQIGKSSIVVVFSFFLHDYSMATRLEDLPTELFFSIFDYLWAHELFYSFGNLTKRIDEILVNTQLH